MGPQNTPGVGTEYEVYVPAYFALTLNENPQIENFQIRSNVVGFGNCDDLIIDVQTKTEELHFAIQLKHKEKKSFNIAPGSFIATKGDFSLEKYAKGFRNFKDKNKKYHLLLYTNGNFDPARIEEVPFFTMTENYSCPGQSLFDTNSTFRSIYKFEVNEQLETGVVTVEDYTNFFQHFSLYTNQKNFIDFEKGIYEILKAKDVVKDYIHLFRKWHQGFFTNKIMDRRTVNLHLVDFLLSPFIIAERYLSTTTNEDMRLFELAVRKFDVTVINGTKQDINCLKIDSKKWNNSREEDMIRLAKDIKIIGKFNRTLRPEDKRRVHFYFFEEPIFINLDKQSKHLIYRAVEICHLKENGIKLVLLSQLINFPSFQNVTIFTTLTDLRETDNQIYEDITRKCQVSFQGRDKISLETLIGWYKEVEQLTETKEILKMLGDNFRIGEKKEELPKSYVPRRISKIGFDAKTFLKHVRRKGDLVIIDANNNFSFIKRLLQQEGMKFVEIDSYLEPVFYDNVIIARGQYFKSLFDNICAKNTHRNVYFCRIIEPEFFLLLLSTQKIFKRIEPTKIYLAENRIHSTLNGPINALCASPGMGKSVLFKYLKNTCSSEFWTVAVYLRSYNAFFKKKPPLKKVLRCFKLDEQIKDFTTKIKRVLFERRKMVLFFDGLDELELECVDYVLRIAKQISLLGYTVWISSRQNLQKKVENYLQVFSAEIEELSEDIQEKYITDRLGKRYTKDEIMNIVVKIFSSTDLASNRKILAVPLQLFIITQIFLDNDDYYKNLKWSTFVLTKIFRIFFEGKYKFLCKKRGDRNNQFELETLDDWLENYEIVGLQTCFSKDVLKKLKIDLRRTRKFLNNVKSRGDPLGIITRINKDNKAIFEHYTYAEYFASVFFSKNFDKVRLLTHYFFSEQYQNFRTIFNILLAEESPLLLGVIYKDIDQIKKYLNDKRIYDFGGRNPLHLASSNCQKFQQIHYSQKCCFDFYLVKDSHLQCFEGEVDINKEILTVLSKFDPLKKDVVFFWNSLEYCEAANCLFPMEIFLRNKENLLEISSFLLEHFKDVTIAYYSSRFAYPNLLSTLLDRRNNTFSRCLAYFGKPSILNTRTCNGDSLLHLAVKPTSSRPNQEETDDEVKVLEILLNAGIQINAYNKYGMTASDWAFSRNQTRSLALLTSKGGTLNPTIKNRDESSLYKAIQEENLEMIDLLVCCGIEVNTRDDQGRAALHVALENGKLKAANHLVEKGASLSVIPRKMELFLHEAAAKGTDWRLVELLLRQDLDVNARNEDGNSALHIAAARGHSKILNLLVKRGAHVNATNNEGNTPLHEACNAKLADLISYFTSSDSNVRSAVICPTFLKVFTNLSRSSPSLQEEVMKKHIKIIKTLINRNADIYAVNKCNCTPLNLVEKNGHLEAVNLIKEREKELFLMSLSHSGKS